MISSILMIWMPNPRIRKINKSKKEKSKTMIFSILMMLRLQKILKLAIHPRKLKKLRQVCRISKRINPNQKILMEIMTKYMKMFKKVPTKSFKSAIKRMTKRIIHTNSMIYQQKSLKILGWIFQRWTNLKRRNIKKNFTNKLWKSSLHQRKMLKNLLSSLKNLSLNKMYIKNKFLMTMEMISRQLNNKNLQRKSVL